MLNSFFHTKKWQDIWKVIGFRKLRITMTLCTSGEYMTETTSSPLSSSSGLIFLFLEVLAPLTYMVIVDTCMCLDKHM